jgi:hypothetical protein
MKKLLPAVYNPLLLAGPAIDQTGVEERTARFTKRSIKAASKMQGLLLTLRMIDLTTLEGKDSVGKVEQLCYKALHLHDISLSCTYRQKSLTGLIGKGCLRGYCFPLGAKQSTY